MIGQTHPPEIDAERCIGCRVCAEACPAMVIEMKEDKAAVERPSWCIACGHCVAVCPVGAVTRGGRLPEELPRDKEEISSEELERLLKGRRSIRVYKPSPVPQEAWNRILDTARFAPTGTNSQNVEYVAVNDDAKIDEIRTRTVAFYEKLFDRVKSPVQSRLLALIIGKRAVEQLRFYAPSMRMAMDRIKEGDDPLFHGAPALLVAHTPRGDPSSPFNAAAALYSCCLMAEAMGLGSCFNGFLEAAANHDKEVAASLDLPKGRRCTGAMTLGYPDVEYHRLVERRSPRVKWM